MKKLIFSLAVLLFCVNSSNAAAVDKKETKLIREPAANNAASMPEECLTVVQQVAAAAGSAVMGNSPSDFSVSNVKVTYVGPPPAPAEGPKMPLSYRANVTIAGQTQATVSVRIVRGGCMVTNYNE